MVENKGEKKTTIWLYAVILFTSAFIVLLLTAYSQIKLNRSINEYRNQIYSEKKEKSNFQLDLISSLKEKKKLNDMVKSLEDELSGENLRNKEIAVELKDLNNKYAAATHMYEMLLTAESEYLKGNMTGCAGILNSQTDAVDLLDKKGQEMYRFLVDNTFKKAAEELYIKGYDDYIKRQYDSAINKFHLSLSLSKSEYFSDDCLYFIAYSQYWKKADAAAGSAIQTLLKDYPGSNYRKDALNLLQLLKN